jgi:hypothetical protein
LFVLSHLGAGPKKQPVNLDVRFMNPPLQVCVFCGENEATTRDHVPPRSIFAAPLPSDMITVPSCVSCNNGSSATDEAFRIYLSLHVGQDSPEKKALWENHSMLTLKHNRRLKREVIENFRRGEVNSAGGLYLGAVDLVKWDSGAHAATVEKIVRGLYFHQFGEMLGSEVRVKTQWLQAPITSESGDPTYSAGSIGGDAFRYLYAQSTELPQLSVWQFQFYSRHWASGYSDPSNVQQ